MTAALLVVLPFVFLGMPSGHDFEFHLSSWMETVNQWKQGIVYPRWAALAHFGYGEARFIFYPPFSWMLGAAIGTVFPWYAAPAIYIWITLSLSGLCMYRLAREWLPAGYALGTAVLYAVNPYHIAVVYWRSAYAELLAAAFFPLMFLWILRARTGPRQALLPLSLTLGAIWLSNAPGAVIATYSLVLLGVLFAVFERNWRVLACAGAALGLALGLAAFYIIPAAWEQKWVNIGQVLSPGVRPADNFLFTSIADPEHTIFNLLISLVAVGEMIVLAITILLAGNERKNRRTFWRATIVWAAVSALLMFRVTNVVWGHLPKLKFVQIPWRWLVPFNVAFVMILGGAVRSRRARGLYFAVLAASFLLLSHFLLAPWWDQAQDIAEMHRAVLSGKGYEGTDEYVPIGADAYELKEDAPTVEVVSPDGVRVANAGVKIESWRPEQRSFSVSAKQSSKLVLRLLNYPAWRAWVDGKAAATETADVTGQMIIAVPAGTHRITLRFERTRDRSAGIVISIISLVLAIALFRAGGAAFRIAKP